MYHDVVPDEQHAASGFPGADAALYKISPGEFGRHLAALSSALRAPIKVLDLAEHRGAATPWMLTFDDGGISAATTVADRLEALGWRGHFMLATDYIGTASFLSPGQIRELDARGHVIGSHSCSHPLRMASCGWPQLQREWQHSLARLSDILGHQVQVGSVPGGLYSRGVAEAAAEAGMRMLFTSEPRSRCWRVEGCLVLGRYTIQRWMSGDLASALAQGRTIPCLRQAMVWNAKKATKRLSGSYYLKVRSRLIGRTR
jgi:peptidoglycan/xylan/chitin deacetylase (PgdA/CDA1 family)